MIPCGFAGAASVKPGAFRSEAVGGTMHSPGGVVPEELELPPPEELEDVPELPPPLEDPPPPPDAPEDEPPAPPLEVELALDPPPEDPEDPPLVEDPDVEPPLPEDPDAEPPLADDPDPDPLLPGDTPHGDVLAEHPSAMGATRARHHGRTSESVKGEFTSNDDARPWDCRATRTLTHPRLELHHGPPRPCERCTRTIGCDSSRASGSLLRSNVPARLAGTWMENQK
jgi:hypothetical protein